MLLYGSERKPLADDVVNEAKPPLSTRLRSYFFGDRAGRLVALLTFVLSFSTLLLLLPHQGLTDDDDFYAPAGISYANWVGDALTSPSTAFDQKRIDRAFKINREHPPFAKYVIGASHIWLHKKLGVLGPLDGARAGVSLLCALMLAFMVRLLWRPFGPLPAVFSAVATLALPRFLFHSQVATLDVPVAAMVVMTVAALFFAEGPHTDDGAPGRDASSTSARRWAAIAGVLFGLALLTKLNAPFLAIPATLWAVAMRWRGFRLRSEPVTSTPTTPNVRVPAIPRSLLWMLFAGPVVFVAGWPWLWQDGFKRFGAYVAFHTKHYPIYLFYEGEIFDKPFAPWTMPFTMAWAVVPLPLLVLGLVGVGLGVRACWRLVRVADDDGHVQPLSLQDRLSSLLVLQAFFAIGAVAFSNVPKYGGEKLFMPFFPLFMMLAALGLRRLLLALSEVWPPIGSVFGWCALNDDDDSDAVSATTPALVVVGALAFVAVLPGYLGTVKTFGGFGLSYYSESIGGLRGATAYGYERTYYDIADKELATWLDDNAGKKTIHFEPNHKEYVRTYRWLKKGRRIRQSVQLSKSKDADLVVLTHERRWKTYPGLYARYRGWKVVHEKRIDGVPLYTVYENPRHQGR